MKRFFLNRASSLLTASLVMAGALMAQPVFALLAGTATSTGNTVTAVGADIDIDQNSGASYSTSENNALSAQFTASPQTIFAGKIWVRNPAGGTPNWDVGYDLVNAAAGTPAGASATLNTALKIAINATTTGSTCDAVSGTTVPTQGTAVITQGSSTAWVGNLITDRTTLNDTSGGSAQEEQLCFYLILPAGNDAAGGGSVSYNLTFTAN